MPGRDVTLSIVSHGQNALVNQLLRDVQRVCAGRVALVLTQNIADPDALAAGPLECAPEIIVNPQPRGFGANHNAAFRRCCTPFFCVANPDVHLPADPFPALLQAVAGPHAAVAGPLVRNPEGGVEDSARRFPTAGSLLKKLFSGTRAPDYPADQGPLEVDWLAGMFLLFRSDAYRAVGGFDEAYFLYYEDVDICRRLRKSGNAAVYEPRAEVVHDARRASRREAGLALHHMKSALRFLSRG